jgi:hypothetical protein
LTIKDDQRPPNLGSITLRKHRKVREQSLMMSHQMTQRMKIQVEMR